MAVFYQYTEAILGSQSTVNGNPPDYGAGIANGSTWSWSGSKTTFTVQESDGATNFNGDVQNEQVSSQERIGGVWEQVVAVDGTNRQVIWDYTFEIEAADGTTFRVAVIDVDLNNDNDLNDNDPFGRDEDGFFLVFPDGVPPPDVDYAVNGIINNGRAIRHLELGADVVCFAAGTLIRTPGGDVPIEELAVGDLVETAEHGAKPVQWIGKRHINLHGPNAAVNKMVPVRIMAGALGRGLPRRDLLVSRQHRMQVSSPIAKRLCDSADVLVSAIKLTALPGIFIDHDVAQVEYVHLLFDRHEIITAEGAPSESLFTGPQALKAVSPAARQEILTLFPELAKRDYTPEPALPLPTGRLQKQLVARHLKNGKPLLR